LDMFLAGLAYVPGIDSWNYIGVMMLVGAVVGLALVLPTVFERKDFRHAHPFVEDFYTADQKSQARSALLRGLVVGIGFVVVGLVILIVLQAVPWLATAVCLMLAAVGVFIIVRGYLLGLRCDLVKYNQKSLYGMDDSQIDALDDEDLQVRARQAKRENSMCRIVMSIATAFGLVLLFVPALHAQPWFWLSWVIGGMLCGVIKASHSMRNAE
ncbi:MAG: XRE family transcriptional regulator, partial [Raoultibacter sp.]